LSRMERPGKKFIDYQKYTLEEQVAICLLILLRLAYRSNHAPIFHRCLDITLGDERYIGHIKATGELTCIQPNQHSLKI
jgi:hypothetical protein